MQINYYGENLNFGFQFRQCRGWGTAGEAGEVARNILGWRLSGVVDG